MSLVQVQITRKYLPKFDPTEFLATVGGCLGLWLGLGVVHIVEIIVATSGRLIISCLS